MSELINKIWLRLIGARQEKVLLPVAPSPLKPDGKPSRYLNREISDLQFIQRVADEAQNNRHPLFERLRFLAISVSILDQFYTTRVARLSRFVREHKIRYSPDGLTPTQELKVIQQRADDLMNSQHMIWLAQMQELAEVGIHLPSPDQLSSEDIDWLRSYFVSHILPVITPFTLDEEHPFPFIPSGGICVVLEFETTHILIPLPDNLPRFITLPGESIRHVSFESIIFEFSDVLLSDETLLNCGLFQILRDNDLARQEHSADLRSKIESGLRLRHKANVIRLKVEGLTEENIRFIAGQLGLLTDEDIELMDQQGESVTELEFVSNSLPGLSHVSQLINANTHPELVFPPFTPRYPQRVKDFGHDCFAAIAKKDLLVHWPYESFDVVVRFLDQAASDERVLSIKQTLYRTSDDSPIVNAMVNAAASGKAVTAIIELEARDNEQSNVALAKRLEVAGVQIVYGIVGLKIHCKLTTITRREGDNTVIYSHFGTGNYHPENAKTYTDISFFTMNQQLGRDAGRIFNYITSEYFQPTSDLTMAPKQLRQVLTGLIDKEISNALAGKPAQIWVKLNSITDKDLIEKLYEASEAGVEIELIIRRQCSLIPGVKGMSSNIHVKSIVGRFLEHSRIYCFANGETMGREKALIYLASADWMERNLDDRVEVMVPIWDETVRTQLLEQIMVANLKDNLQSWNLQADGEYLHAPVAKEFCAQSYFLAVPNLSGLGSMKEETKIGPVEHA